MRANRIYSGYRVGKPDGGPACEQLERNIEKHYGVKHARVFNSATSALHAAIVAAGVPKFSRILVPGYSMSASAASILHAQCTPIFVDIGKDYCIDWNSPIVQAGGFDAVVLVHLFGHHATVPDWIPVSLPVIHDCAQSPSVVPSGGRPRDIYVYSFNQWKIVQCGEGGYALTNNPALAARLHAVRNHGECYTEDILGWNYRMTEMQAEIALDEFSQLNSRLIERREWAANVCKELEGEEGISINTKNVDWFLVPIRCFGRQRDDFARRVRGRIGYHQPIYGLPYFSKRWPDCRLSEIEATEKELVIIDPNVLSDYPSFRISGASESDAGYVLQADAEAV